MRFRRRPNFTAAVLGGSIATIIIWILGMFGWDPPPEVAAAIVTVVSAVTVEGRQRAVGNGGGKEDGKSG